MIMARRLLLLVLAAALVPLTDRPREHRPPYQAEWLPAGEVHVRALRTGRGDTTIVLLHGYGESLLAFRALVAPLAERFRVVALDLPGSGLSQKPAGPYDLPSMVGRLEDFLSRETSGPLILLGHSMGGELAAALAIEYPARVVAVILIAPAGYDIGLGFGEGALSESQRTLIGWSLKARGLVAPDEDPGWLAPPPGVTMDDSEEQFAAAADAILRQFDFRALRGRFGELRQPTLLIWGGVDPLIPIGIGRMIAAEIPCVDFVEIPTSWHRPHVEQPSRVIQAIRDFLDHGHARCT